MVKNLILSAKIILIINFSILAFNQDSLISAKEPEKERPVSNFTPYLIGSLLVPGCGQFALGHKVKGGFLFSGELLLLSSGANDGFYLTRKWRERADVLSLELKKPFLDRDFWFNGQMVSRDSLERVDTLEYYNGEYRNAESIRNRTLVWASGFHLYNLLDCYEYLDRSRRNVRLDQDRSPTGALIRSFILPGWGQLYNKEYSKLGLMVMAIAGFSMNIYVWNRTGNYYGGMKQKYQVFSESMTSVLKGLEESKAAERNYVSRVAEQMKDTIGLSQAAKDSVRLAHLPDSLFHSGILKSLNSASVKVSEGLSYSEDLRLKNYYKEKRFYSDRNQNIWYLFAVYLYAAFDSYVDAHLSGFERKMEFGMRPESDGLAFNVNYHFK